MPIRLPQACADYGRDWSTDIKRQGRDRGLAWTWRRHIADWWCEVKKWMGSGADWQSVYRRLKIRHPSSPDNWKYIVRWFWACGVCGLQVSERIMAGYCSLNSLSDCHACHYGLCCRHRSQHHLLPWCTAIDRVVYLCSDLAPAGGPGRSRAQRVTRKGGIVIHPVHWLATKVLRDPLSTAGHNTHQIIALNPSKHINHRRTSEGLLRRLVDYTHRGIVELLEEEGESWPLA